MRARETRFRGSAAPGRRLPPPPPLTSLERLSSVSLSRCSAAQAFHQLRSMLMRQLQRDASFKQRLTPDQCEDRLLKPSSSAIDTLFPSRSQKLTSSLLSSSLPPHSSTISINSPSAVAVVLPETSSACRWVSPSPRLSTAPT